MIRALRAGADQGRLSGALRPAVFFDRDGTLNREVNYVRAPEQLELLDGVAAAIRRLNAAGWLTVVVTNQSILAHGELTVDGLQRIQARLDDLLADGGAYLDATYTCPHHPGGSPGGVAALTIECDCRKPRTGLLDAACGDLLIDRRGSWLVGDTSSDIEMGRRAGVKTILVSTGHAGRDGKCPLHPDYATADVPAAVDWILEGHDALSRRMAPVAAAAVSARLVLIDGSAAAGHGFAAQVLREILAAAGRTARILPLDPVQDINERIDASGSDDVVIVEGVSVLRVGDLVRRADVQVQVDAAGNVRKA